MVVLTTTSIFSYTSLRILTNPNLGNPAHRFRSDTGRRSKMSTLKKIREALKNNKNIFSFERNERTFLPSPGESPFYQSVEENGFSHSIQFYVSPKEGLYTTKELNEMLISLIPNECGKPRDICKFQEKENAEGRGVARMVCGRLEYIEVLGREHLIQNLVIENDDPVPARKGALIAYYDQTRKTRNVYINRELLRWIEINVFPNVLFAKLAMDGDFKTGFGRFYLYKEEFEKYRRVWEIENPVS